MSTALQPLDKQLKGLTELLERLKPQMTLALPKHLTADRMARIVLTQIRKTPKLLQCDPMSLASAVMTASQLGLEPDGIEAHLIPFDNNRTGKTECQLIADYKGLAKLAWQSEMVTDMRARCIYEGDNWKHVLGDEEKIVHLPITPADPSWPKKDGKPVEPDDREILAAYAIVKIAGGGIQRELVLRYELEALRERQAGPRRDPKRASPWWGHFDQMCRKTALRRALKLVPRSSSRASRTLQAAVVADELAESGVTPDMLPLMDLEPPPPENGLDRLTKKLSGGKASNASAPAGSPPATVDAGGPTQPPAEPPENGDEIVEASVAEAPACFGCGKNDPEPEGVDLAGRAWHGACLRVLQIQTANQPKHR